MANNAHVEVFFNRPVKTFEGPGGWEGPDKAYRVSITWDDSSDMMRERLQQLVEQADAGKLQALVTGAWTGDDPGTSSELVVQMVAEFKDLLPGLRAIFLGDIIVEENEISWIEQSDVTPLLTAFPKLEIFRVRGGNSLKFSKVRHESLRQLIVETGGMRRATVREICRCEFPQLDHLELWLGVENYGFDGGVEDLQPILTGKRFPRLRYLGLRNSDIADEIAPVLVNAPILRQLDVLDLSNGTLTDVGGRALLNLPSDLPLRELNLTHHYLSPEMVQRLTSTLKYKVIADDGQDPNAEWRSVVVSE